MNRFLNEPSRFAAISDRELLVLHAAKQAGVSRLHLFDLETGTDRWTVSFETPFDSSGSFHRHVDVGGRRVVWWFPGGRGSLPRIYCLDRDTGSPMWQTFERLLGLSEGGLLQVSERHNRILLLSPFMDDKGQFLYLLALDTGELIASVRLAAAGQRARAFPPERLAYIGFVGPRKILLVRGHYPPRTVAAIYDEKWERPELWAMERMALIPLTPELADTSGPPQFFFWSDTLMAWGSG
jgi:hypothetical protein